MTKTARRAASQRRVKLWMIRQPIAMIRKTTRACPSRRAAPVPSSVIAPSCNKRLATPKSVIGTTTFRSRQLRRATTSAVLIDAMAEVHATSISIILRASRARTPPPQPEGAPARASARSSSVPRWTGIRPAPRRHSQTVSRRCAGPSDRMVWPALSAPSERKGRADRRRPEQAGSTTNGGTQRLSRAGPRSGAACRASEI